MSYNYNKPYTIICGVGLQLFYEDTTITLDLADMLDKYDTDELSEEQLLEIWEDNYVEPKAVYGRREDWKEREL
jgi:hypothetical protein